MVERNVSMAVMTPDPLLELALQVIANKLDIISRYDPISKEYKLREDIILPTELCEKIFHSRQKNKRIKNSFVSIFLDKSRTRLKRFNIRNSPLTDASLNILLEHKPQHLGLVDCDNLSTATLEFLNRNAEQLVSLVIGPLTDIIDSSELERYQARGFVLRAPRLRRLTVQRCQNNIFPRLLLEPLKRLTHLDLSECAPLSELTQVQNLKCLTSLVLYNVYWMQDAINWICNIRTLQHLDISQSNDRYGKFYCPNQVLGKIITELPKLISLDISGTNLAGSGAASALCSGASDIPGLCTRASKPLEFLGLYGTQHSACKRHDIPAIRVAGDANEDQVLNAATVYMDRCDMMTRILNDLYHLFRYENDLQVSRSLRLVLQAMQMYLTEKHIQISGSATLFYIVKLKDKWQLNIKLKEQIVHTLLDAMATHIHDETMMRNGCLTLCQFKIPSEVLFAYERVVAILLYSIVDPNQEVFVQRITIYLLNSLACQVNGEQKQFLGYRGAISKMLMLIANRVVRQMYDDVLEVAWSTMWNVTDETPINCERFLNEHGMDYFLQCLKCFPEKDELLRNMMGLLGNVAEVAELRPQLMTTQFISVFYDLLDSESDGIEVSYNAAGVLAHIAYDGADKWTIETPSRHNVLQRMKEAIERWDLRSERNINYRSFEPILSLLNVRGTPQCQHWAVWALANLTSVYPEKYCELLDTEGGCDMLEALIRSTDTTIYDRIKILAKTAVSNCVVQSLLTNAVIICD